MSSATQGRPRDERINTAVIAATLELLDELGYSALTMECVATRADTSKPAIRRRWPSLRHLVIDAVATTISDEPAPDTGCTHCDLIKDIEKLTKSFLRTSTGSALQGLLGDLPLNPDLAETFYKRLFLPRREATIAVLKRGVARGDIRPELDVNLLVDMLASTTYFRVYFGHLPVTKGLGEEAVMVFMSGVSTSAWRAEHTATAHSEVGRTARGQPGQSSV